MTSLTWIIAEYCLLLSCILLALSECHRSSKQQNTPFYMFRLKFLEKYQASSQQFSLPQFVNKNKDQTSPVLYITEACSRTDSFLLQYLKHLQCKTHTVFRHAGGVSGLATMHPTWFRQMGQFNKSEIALTHVVNNIVIPLNL